MSFITSIYDAMYEHGIEFIGYILPIEGKWQRFQSCQKPHRNLDVYVCIILNGRKVIFGDWNLSDKPIIFTTSYSPLSSKEKEQIKQQLKKIKYQQNIAINQCRKLWHEAQESDDKHPYLIRKKIPPIYIRQINHHLIIPICNIHGDIVSLQSIAPDGFKKIYPNTTYKNGFLFLGEKVTQTIRLVEGYATGVSIHMATDDLTVVCFTAHNLSNVAILLKQRFPNSSIEICCDNDRHKKENKGIHFAIRAAKTIGAVIRCPRFDLIPRSQATDFNDLHVLCGIEAVEGQLFSKSFTN
jgi:putative DNA primase/helicase